MTPIASRLIPYDGPCPRCGGELVPQGFDRRCPACPLAVEAALETIELAPEEQP